MAHRDGFLLPGLAALLLAGALPAAAQEVRLRNAPDLQAHSSDGAPDRPRAVVTRERFDLPRATPVREPSAPAGPRADRAWQGPVAGAPAFASGHIVVRFAPGVAAAAQRQITRELGGRALLPAHWGGFARVEVADGEKPRALLRRFRASPAVEVAELDPIGSAPTVRVASGSARAASNGPDPLLPLQWHLDRIRWHEARRALGLDGTGATVAVLDTGVRNRAAPRCTEGNATDQSLDLDATRFAPGYDFVDDDPEPLDEGYEVLGDDPCGIGFLFGHGTFNASLIAAAAGNGYGGAGVAPGTTILPIRVLDRRGTTTLSRLAEAIHFAAEQGADVIHISVGAPEGSIVLAEAVRAAHAAGAVLVAPVDHRQPGRFPTGIYPAAYPEVIAVRGTDQNDVPWPETGGPYAFLDLAAPGGSFDLDDGLLDSPPTVSRGVLSGSFIDQPPPAVPGFDLCADIQHRTHCDFYWAVGSGFAAAQVSAAAALLVEMGIRDPETIRRLLHSGARTLGSRDETGHGLLDLYRTLAGLGFSFD